MRVAKYARLTLPFEILFLTMHDRRVTNQNNRKSENRHTPCVSAIITLFEPFVASQLQHAIMSFEQKEQQD